MREPNYYNYCRNCPLLSSTHNSTINRKTLQAFKRCCVIMRVLRIDVGVGYCRTALRRFARIPRQARNDGGVGCAVRYGGMWVVLFCTVYNCRGALLHKKTPRVRSFFCLRLSILLQNASLFEFDGCADFFELVCHFLGFRFGNVFFNGRRRAVNERFRFG